MAFSHLPSRILRIYRSCGLVRSRILPFYLCDWTVFISIWHAKNWTVTQWTPWACLVHRNTLD